MKMEQIVFYHFSEASSTSGQLQTIIRRFIRFFLPQLNTEGLYFVSKLFIFLLII